MPASDRPDDRPIVLVAHDRTPLVNGVVLRRTNVLPAGHVVGRDDGVRLTVPARTWFDCARDLSDDDFEGLTERVVDHLAPVPALWAAVRELDARGRPGLARVRRVLDARREWNKPVGSRLEQLLVDGLSRRGVGPSFATMRSGCATAPRSMPTSPTSTCAGPSRSITWGGTVVASTVGAERRVNGRRPRSAGASSASPTPSSAPDAQPCSTVLASRWRRRAAA